ncbi:MAG TPA: 1,4-alpha-glucan-branching enzyme, partial [Bacteroidales bacterium]|nr:1,4-alpha-glucan-branching enzyme [Bacteroidales bacterium]
MKEKPRKKLALAKNDPWLAPASEDIIARYERYQNTLGELEAGWNSLGEFANGYKYYGFNYDPERKGWHFREWAPKAQDVYL